MTKLLLTKALWPASLLLLLTGCGDDRPVAYAPPRPASSAPPPDAPTGGDSAPSGGGSAPAAPAPARPADPLLSGSADTTDPLAAGDPLSGPSMPTQHSHWLRGSLRGARVTVLLNGTRQGIYFGPVDKDITMRLRRGLNLVTFVYQPTGADSSAQLEVLESEHTPPIPPLVVYQHTSLPGEATDSKPESQTFTFIAK